MKTSGNTVLITGGASGIGLELARQLLALDNAVLVTGRDQAKLEQAQRQLPGLRTYRSDVGDPDAVHALFERVVADFPALNVLVNNAGIMRKLNLQSSNDDLTDLTREIEINLMGPLRMIQVFLPQLRRQPEAAILNVSSGLAFVPLAVSPIYSAAKAGLHSYTRSLRVQLKHTQIKVFELAAPVTQTPLLSAFSSADLEGSPVMTTEAMVTVVVDALRRDHFEIRPGISNKLKLMSRIAPQFIFNQLSKSVDAMLADAKQERAPLAEGNASPTTL